MYVKIQNFTLKSFKINYIECFMHKIQSNITTFKL